MLITLKTSTAQFTWLQQGAGKQSKHQVIHLSVVSHWSSGQWALSLNLAWKGPLLPEWMLIDRSSTVNTQLHQKSPAFWYQGLWLWKTIFPWVGLGGEGWFERMRATDEASLAHLPLPSWCVAWFLTGHGPVPVCGSGIGDPWVTWLSILTEYSNRDRNNTYK